MVLRNRYGQRDHAMICSHHRHATINDQSGHPTVLDPRGHMVQ